MKVCSKCKIEKDNNEFHTGFGYCKKCRSQQSKVYYALHQRETIERAVKYQREHKERKNANGKRWRTKHPEKNKEVQKKYYEANKDKKYADSLRWRKKHPDKVLAGNHAYMARVKGAYGQHTSEEWNMLCAMYGNICLCCGKTGKLSRDHIVPIRLGGTNNIDNLQPLCGHCNSSKGARTVDYRPNHYWADWT